MPSRHPRLFFQSTHRGKAGLRLFLNGHTFFSQGHAVNIFMAIATLVGLFLAKLHSYNLFHILAEFYSIAIACAIFLFAWNTRWLLENRYLLIVGIAYLFVGAIDLVHTLTYKGMGVFLGYDANLPTQLWIGARYMQSMSFLIAPMFMKKRFNSGYVFLGCGAATALFLFSTFYWQNFPDCFIEGAGLTPFKVASEYVISAILLGSLYLLHKNKESFDQKVLKLITFSILVHPLYRCLWHLQHDGALSQDPLVLSHLRGHYCDRPSEALSSALERSRGK
jgi:hypothetical protein